MKSTDLKIRSAEGPEFDCYVVAPDGANKTPAIVLASAIHGVDKDLRGIADAFASHGYLAAAPDLFWRSTPGPLARDDARSAPRGQPRLDKIRAGERDLVDTLAMVRKQAQFNGRAAVIGFCYGGPYAVLGPKRLGYDAGIACHGSQMMDYLPELEGLGKPVCILWGEKDHLAPQPVLEAYRAAAAKMKSVELHVFPGVEHGYMMKDAQAYDRKAYDFSLQRALAILEALA